MLDDGSFIRSYVHMPGVDQVVGFVQEDTLYYYVRDEQGNVTDLFNAVTMSIAQSYAYDSFGNIKIFNELGVEVTIDNATFKQPFTFTSREYDFESGLYYYRARYYDSNSGRFMSEDSISFAGGDMNLYRYVGNNHVNFTDPSGLLKIDPSTGATAAFQDAFTGNFVPRSQVTKITPARFVGSLFALPAIGAAGSIAATVGPSVTGISAGSSFALGLGQGLSDSVVPPGSFPSINPIIDPISEFIGERLGTKIRNSCGR